MKNKYVVAANQWWLTMVWVLSVALTAQAQSTQAPMIQWQRVIEGDGKAGPVAGRPTIIKNSQGGYSVVTADNRLLSLTSSGDVVADTPITGVFYDRTTTPSQNVRGLAPTSDGGVVVGVQDNLAWALQKRDAGGSVVWVTRFLPSKQCLIANVLASSDGGFVAFATYQGQDNAFEPAHVIVNKVDKDGIQVWYKEIRYPNASGTFMEQAISTVDGGYLLAGSTYAPSDNNTIFRGWSARLDAAGNALWQNRYDQINGLNGVALNGVNSNYVINGPTFSNSPPSFAPSSFIIDNSGKLRSDLPVVQVPFTAFTSLASITSVPPPNRPSVYAVANDTPTNVNGGDIRLTSFSDRGDVVWTKTLGGSGRDYSYKPAVLATDNGFVVVGITESTDGDVKGKQNNRPATWIVKLEDPTKPFTLVQPTYNCETGTIFFGWIGGDGSPITYDAPGISRSLATSNVGIVEQGLRNDPKPITITATQSGHTDSYTFDFNAYCKDIQPPVLIAPIPDLTVTIETRVSETVNQYFSRDPRGNVVFTAQGISATGLSFYDDALSIAHIEGYPRTTGVYTVTVTATNTVLSPPNNSVSATFKITVVDKPVVNPPTPPTGGTLALAQPTYNCVTGDITFNTTGGDGSSITYNAPGISRSSATSSTGTVEPGLRNDPKPITIQATQSGQTVSYTFDLGAYCANSQPPVGNALTLLAPTYDCTTGAFRFNVSGGDGTAIEYQAAPGITGWTTNPNQFVDEESRTASDVKPFTLMARQNGVTVSYTWNLRAVCPNPPTDNPLTLLAPTYDCATGAIRFNTTGGNGTLIEYRAAPGITGWTTDPSQFVDEASRTANDVKPFTLMARQSGVLVNYVWDLKAACGRARQGVAERVAELSVSVLGNPVSEAVTVEIRGAVGQPLNLRLVDTWGRLVESRTVEQAGAVERQRFALPGSGPGLLLLRASSGTQSQTVKILKQ